MLCFEIEFTHSAISYVKIELLNARTLGKKVFA